ncbi:MAG: AAA family ATPase [Bacteroidia bacterium]|nr:AAA family ATPase [Bacteroidia bacterium]
MVSAHGAQDKFVGDWNSFQTSTDESGKKILIKTLLSNNPGPAEITRYENELFFAGHEQIEGVRQVYGQGESGFSLKLEWIDGVTLDQWQAKNADLRKGLDMCIALSSTIMRLHNRGIIYKNISPRNILIRENNQPVLIDLGLATSIVSRSQATDSNNFIGDVNFISPEQTGRINRLVDHRTDLYSLGALMYFIFSGKVPFPGEDRLEKVHSHIALNAQLLEDIVENFPPQISKIVGKLLAKSPEQRYQSAYGVYHDLYACKEELEKGENISNFPLQTQDFHGELVFTNKLYGRELEVGILDQAFEHATKGQKSFISITGFSGIGKTAVVSELYEPVFKNRGMLLSGKFEKYQRDIPYFGFKQAFREFVQNVKSQDDGEIAAWKNNIHNATDPVGNVLIDLLPELDFLVGEQPELPELNGPEAQNRFNYVILSFLKAIAAPGSPLVVFLDDLQWADSSSLQLIKVLLADSELKHIMVVGAYRDNEVTPDHPVSHLLNDINASGALISEMHLDNLSIKAVSEMLEDVLQIHHEENVELTEIVYKKSQGNALFIHQFLKAARVEGTLSFDFDERRWIWDKEKILRQNLSGEVEELLTAAVSRLPEETRQVLTLASCIGISFKPALAVSISGIAPSVFKKNIQPALLSGLVLENNGLLFFGHDKIQQVLYEQISEKERAKIHFRIAENIHYGDESSESIFDVVNQWNKCLILVEDPAEKLSIAKLNYEAGLKARSSVAFKEALQYFENAIHLLPANFWESEYDFSLLLHNYSAETAYLSGMHDLSENFVEKVVANARSVEDKSTALIYRIRAYTAENKLVEAIATGYDLLQDLGVKIPRKPGKLTVVMGLISTGFKLRGKSEKDILALPHLQDKKVKIIMDVIFAMLAPAYFAMPDFLPVGIFKLISLTLKYGLGTKSPYGFLGFGYIHSAFLGNIITGTKFGNVGFALHKKLDTLAMASTVYGIYYALTNHWTTHLPDTISGLKEGFKYGLETGDIEYTSYLAHNIVYHNFYSGKNLPETLAEGVGLLHQIESFNLEVTQARIAIFLQSIHDLIEEPLEYGGLEGAYFSTAQNKYKPEKQNHILFHNLYFQKMIVALIYGNGEKAWENIQEIELYQESVQGSALFPLLFFYRPLCMASVYHKYPEKQAYFKKAIRKDVKRLKKYMAHSQQNYSHKYWLALAELEKLNGDMEKAQTHYFSALRQARQNKLVQDEALVWERTGDFYFEQGQAQVADFYYNNAYLCYKRWGASGKTAQLVRQFPNLASIEFGVNLKEADDLDLATVVKAYNAIAGEIIMSKLLEKLLQIMIENAGAQRGLLIRDLDGARTITAVLDNTDAQAEVMLDEPVSKSQRLSLTVLNYAVNSGTYVVLDNAMETRPYNTDNYIREHEVKSVICMPVMQQGKHFGYLYLENNLVTGAFTKSRISLLNILASQAAVSLENAELYEGMTTLNTQLTSEIFEKEEAQKALLENEKRLEQYNANLELKVEERTKEISDQKNLIEIEKHKSDELLLNILPEETAEELKKFGKAVPRRFQEVTVLFTDFVDFSKISENVPPDILVNEINYYYSAFDEIISKYKLEKIKTIGDSYMCAGGLPAPMKDHAKRMVMAALEIQNFVAEEAKVRSKLGQVYFNIRIGLHTGPVVAGIVGIKKFAYDIWGDTVNYASRMESGGEAGKVNVSGTTYEMIKDAFVCSYRGKIAVKSKGEIDMYFVEKSVEE